MEVWICLSEAEIKRQEELERIKNSPVSRILGEFQLGSTSTETQFLKTQVFDCQILRKPDINDNEIAIEFGKIPKEESVLKALLVQKTNNSLNLRSLMGQSEFCKNLLSISYSASAGQSIQSDVLSIFQDSSKVFKKTGVSASNISSTCGDCAQSTIEIFKTVTAPTDDPERTKKQAISDLNLLAKRAGDMAKEAEKNAEDFDELADRCAKVSQKAVEEKSKQKTELTNTQNLESDTLASLKSAQVTFNNIQKRYKEKKEEFEKAQERLNKLENRQFAFQITSLVTQSVSTIGSAAVSLASPYTKITAVSKEIHSIIGKESEEKNEFDAQKKELEKITSKLKSSNKKLSKYIDKLGESLEEILGDIGDSNSLIPKIKDIQEKIDEVKGSFDSTESSDSDNSEIQDLIASIQKESKTLFTELETKEAVQEKKAQRLSYLKDKKKIMEDLYKTAEGRKALFESQQKKAEIIKKSGEALAAAFKEQANSMEGSIERQNQTVSELQKEKSKLEEDEQNKIEEITNLASKAKNLAAQQVDINVLILMLSITIISLSRLTEMYQNIALFWRGIESSANALSSSGLANELEKVELTSLSRDIALEWYFNTCLWLAIQEACSDYSRFSLKLAETLDDELSSIQSTSIEKEQKQAMNKLKEFDPKKVPNLTGGLEEELKILFAQQEQLKEQAENEKARMLKAADKLMSV